MKEGRGVGSVAGEGKEGEVEKKEGEVVEKEGEVEKKEGEVEKKNTLPQDKTSSQPIKDGKETKRLPPVDANGKPVSVDHHWKEFMKKSGKSGKSQKNGKSQKKDEKKEKKAEKKEKVTTFFDDDTETVGTKKVPLRSK